MSLVQAVNLSHAFGIDVILAGATLSIEPGERIGLVGRNGAGKSTLMRMIAGHVVADSGSVQIQRGARIGYLEQDPSLPADETLRGAAEGAFSELHRLHSELHQLFEDMANAAGNDLTRLLRKQEQLERAIDAAGGYTIDHTIDATLHGLGFTDAQFAIACKDLSGGQRSRLALARLLLEKPDLLLLDEPTNHLDIAGRMWLESFLKNEYPGAVVMVSHDRRLLENVVTRIVEVEQGRLIEYPGAYSTFRKLRYERRLTQQRAWEKQQSDFRRQEQYIQKYKTGQRAKEARGRQKKLDRAKTDSYEKPMELETFSLRLPRAPRSGDIVVSARGLSKRYTNTGENGEDAGKKILFHDFNITIGRGERWGVIGPNGAGKTTLLRCLLGDIRQDEGTVRLGANVALGYFRQTHEDIDPTRPVYRHLQDIIRRENPDHELTEQQSRDLAGAFLFSGDEQEKEMGVLSGGERSRVRLAGLLASAKNLLILDEPTNHLDIPSAERLEEALTEGAGYDGTLLLISHDRALLDATCEHLIVLDGAGNAEIFHGNFSQWHQREQARLANRRAPSATDAAARWGAADHSTGSRSSGRSATQTKSKKPALNTASNPYSHLRLEQIESKIESAECRIRELDAQLNDLETWKDPAAAQRIADERLALLADLEPLEFEWGRRAELN